MARTDDLWPGFHRVAATGFPTAAEVELACAQASLRFKAEAEKTPGTYVDLELADYPVRKPHCRWEVKSASTAICRFEQTEILWSLPTPESREEVLARLKDRDWELRQSRMVRVAGPGDSRWIAPAGCAPIPEPGQ